MFNASYCYQIKYVSRFLLPLCPDGSSDPTRMVSSGYIGLFRQAEIGRGVKLSINPYVQ
jgi:hypothetical protein